MRVHILLLFLLLVFNNISGVAQNAGQIDSLEQSILLTPDNESKVEAYIKLSD